MGKLIVPVNGNKSRASFDLPGAKPVGIHSFRTTGNVTALVKSGQYRHHAVVIMCGDFPMWDDMWWNENLTLPGNLAGGLAFKGRTLYTTHARTGVKKETM